jgi:hypothetical protein
MAYDINADSYPDYDEDGYDDYWKLADWKIFYDKLIQKYGADEGSRRWLDAWWRNDYTSHPILNEADLRDWAKPKGLWNSNFNLNKSNFWKPSEFVPPSVQNEGQVIDGKVVGTQPSIEELEKAKAEQGVKSIKHWLIGGGVVLVGLTIVYFVLRAKNK